jgi:hypothetical protein
MCDYRVLKPTMSAPMDTKIKTLDFSKLTGEFSCLLRVHH